MYVVIGRSQWNFCDTAKAVLKSKGYSYVEYSVDSSSSKWVLTLLKLAQIKTVPQIFDGTGKHIGGYTDLVEHLKEK